MQAVMEGKPPTINLADSGFEVLPNEKYYNIITFSGFALKQLEDVEKTAWWYAGEKVGGYYFSKVGWFYRSGSGFSTLFDHTYMTLFAFYRDQYDRPEFNNYSSRFVITNE